MTTPRELLEKHFSDIGISLDVFGRVHWKSEVVRAAIAAIEEAVREERESCLNIIHLHSPNENTTLEAIRSRGNEGEKR